MPTRILREGIITSEPVNRLSPAAELLYRRLMSVADDYGRYFSHPGIIRGNCYPLQLDRVSETDVKQWLSECTANDLILLYGGKYLLINNFRQQVRGKSKFPEPNTTQTLSNCIAIDKHLRSESEAKAESKATAGAKAGAKAGADLRPAEFTWEMCHGWLKASNEAGSNYTEFEAKTAFLALSAGGWMWGRNPIVDYRAAIERQIQTDRERKNGNGKYNPANKPNPRNANQVTDAAERGRKNAEWLARQQQNESRA